MALFINDKNEIYAKINTQIQGENIMKNVSRFFVGAAALVLLTACGPSKVSYEKFHEQAVSAYEKAKEKTYDVTLKGSYKDEDSGETSKMDNVVLKWNKGAFEATSIAHLDEVAAALIMNGLIAKAAANDENTTYYAGNGFKAITKNDNGESKLVWNKYGLPTEWVSGGTNMTASYK